MSSLNRVRPMSPGRGQRGFSAIEVTAVAAIIAVLALILIPAVNKRVDDSKIAAAKDDLQAIQKAEELAYGYTGHYFRLCDLDRPAPESPQDADAALRVPRAYWNKPIMNQTETNFLVNNWRGPFLPLRRSMSLADIVRTRPELVSSNGLAALAGADGLGGPIYFYEGDDVNWKFPKGGAIAGLDGQEGTQYPIDPWGNPYIFFGAGRYGLPDGVSNFGLDQQNNWGTAAVYCMGPDGYSGSLATTEPTSAKQSKAYFRELWTLGTGDDIKREF